jgi:hypothetical protein
MTPWLGWQWGKRVLLILVSLLMDFELLTSVIKTAIIAMRWHKDDYRLESEYEKTSDSFSAGLLLGWGSSAGFL